MKRFISITWIRITNLLFPRLNRISKVSRFDRRCATLIKSILIINDKSVEAIHFTDIIAKQTKTKITITCTMCRPGLFIGKAGSTIDLVRDTLADYFGKEIYIVIKEKWLWD